MLGVSKMTMQLKIEPSFLPEIENQTVGGQTNIDLIGETYFSEGSIIRIVELEAGRGGKFVIVEDITRKKRWSVPAALIRLILGRRKEQRWKRNAA